MYTSGGQESVQLSRLLDVLPSLCENAVNSGLAWSFSRWSDSSVCSARTQGAMKTGPAPDESPVSVCSENDHITGIRFGAMGPWSQLRFMDLVWIGWFVGLYLLNTSYGHETCTIGYSKHWCVVMWSLRCEPYSYNLGILTQQGFRYTLYLCGMVSTKWSYFQQVSNRSSVDMRSMNT